MRWVWSGHMEELVTCKMAYWETNSEDDNIGVVSVPLIIEGLRIRVSSIEFLLPPSANLGIVPKVLKCASRAAEYIFVLFGLMFIGYVCISVYSYQFPVALNYEFEHHSHFGPSIKSYECVL